MSTLKTLAASIRNGEVLLPYLRNYLAEENKRYRGGLMKRKEAVIADALMTIATFKERIAEYNHGEIVGDYFHPSALGTCQRAMWFDRHGATKQVEQAEDLLRTNMIFETGTYVGVAFMNLCERAGCLVRREAPTVSKKLRILGHADGVVKIEEVTYVLELKTINSNNFRQITAPKDAHKQQAHAYMKVLGLKWAIVLYLEKDRHQFKEYVIPFDPTFYEKHVAKRIDNWFKVRDSKTPPPKEGDSPNMMPCSWCAFKRVCFGSNELAKFMKAKGSPALTTTFKKAKANVQRIRFKPCST